jgi:hypothetical protein
VFHQGNCVCAALADAGAHRGVSDRRIFVLGGGGFQNFDLHQPDGIFPGDGKHIADAIA